MLEDLTVKVKEHLGLIDSPESADSENKDADKKDEEKE